MKKITLLILVLLLVDLSVIAQNSNRAISTFKQETKATIKLYKNLETPGFISFPINRSLSLKGINIETKAYSFLETYKSIYRKNIELKSFKIVKE